MAKPARRRGSPAASWTTADSTVYSCGASDEFGHKAVETVCSIHDFHATIPHLLGLDHERLSFYHSGIERRLTDVHGHVLRDLLA
jgi:hypothetical protein